MVERLAKVGGLQAVLAAATDTALTDAFAASTSAGRSSAGVAWRRYLDAVGFGPPKGNWGEVTLNRINMLRGCSAGIVPLIHLHGVSARYCEPVCYR